MTGGPRLLTIMGSGETAPTMVKVHRQLLDRLGGGPAVLLDTPYGFQENADDISERARVYFAQSVGHPITVASFRSKDVDALTRERAMAAIAEARYVFAGPGSPTYALRQWQGTPLADLLVQKLAEGGGVTFASAAALALGVATVPVYEIYKAGLPPHWEPGLDVVGAATGLRTVVIPHYDNAEGGHHDTRYCYLGERRLTLMERELDDDVVVLGVDEHTALVLDLEAGTASVLGLGGVTVRRPSGSVVVPAGAELAMAELTSLPADRVDTVSSSVAAAPAAPAAPERSPLLAEAARLEAEFNAALERRDVSAAVNAILELERVLTDWSADTLQSDEPDRVRTTLRSMIVRLGDVAVDGARDPREVLGPVVEVALAARSRARTGQDWAASDALRDGLAAAGIEVRDTPAGQDWHLRDG